MNYKFILALDPSGSFKEGKGTTGWCVLNCMDNTIIHYGDITAKSYESMEAYWNAHIRLIKEFKTKYDALCVVMEDYILYESKALAQVNSRFETPKLIGLLQYTCWAKHIPYFMQLASEVKSRWTDDILTHKHYLMRKGKRFSLHKDPAKFVHEHTRDSIRHAVHYAVFKNKEDSNDKMAKSKRQLA